MLVTLCSKFFNQGFSSTWTKNFQTYKLHLEKVEEPEIKLPTFIGSQRKQGISRRNISNLRYVDDTTLMAESEDELQSLLMET